LSVVKQSKVYLPEAPFPHSEVSSNWLNLFSDYEFRYEFKTV